MFLHNTNGFTQYYSRLYLPDILYTYNPCMPQLNGNSKRRRNSLRMPDYDYSSPGVYFVTISTQKRKKALGDICNGDMVLNENGKIVDACLIWLNTKFTYLDVELYCIMPNHIHLLLKINDDPGRGGSRTAPTEEKRKSLSRIVGVFKTVSTKQINNRLRSRGIQFWQRSFYDHVIRNEKDHQLTFDYILSNPENWAKDDENLQKPPVS